MVASYGVDLSWWSLNSPPAILPKETSQSARSAASEDDKVRLRFAGLMRRDRHLSAAAKADGVFARFERIEQKDLVAHCGNLRGLPGSPAPTKMKTARNLRRAVFIGSCPLVAGFRRRKINCAGARAFQDMKRFPRSPPVQLAALLVGRPD
jgi:hypothetical protein